jgi:ATP-dependent RNA helicase RhlE
MEIFPCVICNFVRMPFSIFGFPNSILEVISCQNYSKIYPIQEQAIPVIAKGQDVLGIAKTGSGKTASFVLPILSQISNLPKNRNRHVQVLVLVPTRELAAQISDVFKLFSVGLPQPVKTLAVYGGVSINPQMKALSGVHILVATPGRLLELVESNAVFLSDVKTLVLDEADKILNLGFTDEMNRIFDLLPAKRQNLLFSATLSPNIESMSRVLLHNPITIKIEEDVDVIDTIEQIAYMVEEHRKGPLLRHLIKTMNLTQVLIFASSKHTVDHVAQKLRLNGIDARSIHSNKTQGGREDALSQFKNGKIPVLVATDLISRGIDIEFLPCVINYELPRSPKDYIHRIGRTGRAENPGKAISLITREEEHHFYIIQKKMGKRVQIIDSSTIDFK